MKKQNLIYLGSKEIGCLCLSHILKDLKNEINVLGVFVDKNKRNDKYSVEKLANSNGIKVLYDLDEIFQISDTIDILLSVQYHKILNIQHLECAKNSYNLHMAPLPEFRGCNQFTHAIVQGLNYFGTTLHYMDEGIDSGEIILEERFQINPDNIWIDELISKTVSESYKMFKMYFLNVITDDKFRYRADFDEIQKRNTSFSLRNEIKILKAIEIDQNSAIGKQIRSVHNTSFPPLEIKVGNKNFILKEK